MAELIVPAPSAPSQEHPLLARNLLRWLYIGRLTVVTGIFAGAFLSWFGALPEGTRLVAVPQDTIVVVVMFFVGLVATAGSVWYTHWLGREPSENFLYAQVVLDVLLVTGIVHVTGGPASGNGNTLV